MSFIGIIGIGHGVFARLLYSVRRGAHQHCGSHERSSAVNMKSPAAKDCEGCGATRATRPDAARRCIHEHDSTGCGNTRLRMEQQSLAQLRAGHARTGQTTDHQPQQLEVPRRHPRLRSAVVGRGECPGRFRSGSQGPDQLHLRQPVPARQLVLPVLAPRLPGGLRGDCRGQGEGTDGRRLGASVLELPQ